MSNIWAGQMEEESAYFTPGKYQVNSDKPAAYHWNLTHATEGEGGRAPALSYGQSKHNSQHSPCR